MIEQLKPRAWLFAALAACALLLVQTNRLHLVELRLYTERQERALERETQQKAVATAQASARYIEQTRTETINQALQNESTRATQNRIDADRARRERDGLREQLAGARRAIPHAAQAAVRAYAAAATDVFEQCTNAYIEVAAAADGHASDALTLQQAWPKE